MLFDVIKKFKFILKQSGEINLFYFTLIVLSFIFILEFISVGALPIFVNLVIQNELNFSVGFVDLSGISNYIKNNLLFSCFTLVILYLIKNIFVIFAVYLENIFSYRVVINLSKDLYNHYTSKNLIFFKNMNSAELFRNFSELKRIGAFMRTLQLFIRELLVIVSMLTLLIIINWQITLITSLLLFIVCSIFFIFYKKFSFKIGKEFQENDGKRIKAFYQGLDSIKESKVYGLVDKLKKIFYSSQKKVEFVIVKTDLLAVLPRIFFELIAILFFGLLVYVSFSFFNIEKNKSIYYITIYSTVLIRLLPSFQQLASKFSYLNFHIPAVNLIYKELNNKNHVSKSMLIMNNRYYSQFNKLDVKGLSFSYGNNEDFLLNDINLNIKKYEKIGIYGESGSGKSTLIELITGLIKPTKGSVFYNDIDIYNEEVSINISYIPQQVYLYDTSIKKNINLDFFDEYNDSDLKKLDNSITGAQLDTLIEKSHLGLNTKVGQLGKMISGGQGQRIGIARALYKDSDILILDEFTSSLDQENEKKILKIIETFSDKTIILISHKENLFNNFDKVYQIQNKKLILKKN